MKKITALFCLLSASFCAYPVWGLESLKIAYVNVNEVINTSLSGQKSKKVLEVKVRESEQELRDKEKRITALQKELKESLLLKTETKQKNQEELRKLTREFQEGQIKINQALRREERRHTENIFQDLKILIRDYAKRNNFDMVLEFALYSTVLYAKPEIIDITKEIITEYDKLQSKK